MPGFYPLAIYLDDHKIVPLEECRTEIAITFKGEAKERPVVKIRLMPVKVAIVSHKVPRSEYQKSYGILSNWIQEKGLERARD